MRKAIIELGTNSAKLLVADLYDQDIHIVYEQVVVSRLGENLHQSGIIHPLAFARNQKLIEDFVDQCHQLRVHKISTVATMALREAQNAAEFVQNTKRAVNLDIRILSGEEEARLSYDGALAGLNVGDDNYMVADIGGGSTDIGYGSLNQITYVKSIEMGALMLYNLFGKADPPAASTRLEMASLIHSNLERYIHFAHPLCLVGVGGTIVTLASVMAHSTGEPEKVLHNSKITYEEVEFCLERFVSMDLENRRQIKGMPSGRAEIIIYGALIAIELMKYCGMEDMLVSCRGLRHALLTE